LKTKYIIALALIIVGALAIDYFIGTRYPEEEFQFTGLPTFDTDEHSYRFFRTGEEVGSFKFTIKNLGTNYLMSSRIEVSSEGNQLLLESSYIFNMNYLPEDYNLNVTESDDKTVININFNNNTITTKVTALGETVEIEEEIEEEPFVIENSMPSFWEVLIRSSNLEQGKRYNLEIFVPQSARIVPITLLVEREKENINLDGISYECIVVKESQMELSFYMYEGKLILYRDARQDTQIRKVL
jgi:hypothetical protein